MPLSESEELELLQLQKAKAMGAQVPSVPIEAEGNAILNNPVTDYIAERGPRAAGLAGRHIIQGALGLPAIVAGGVGGAYNVAADIVDKVRGKGVSDLVAPTKGFRFKDPYQQLQQTLTEAGFPEPESISEKLVGVGQEMLSGGAATPVQNLVTRAPPASMNLAEHTLHRLEEGNYRFPPSETGRSNFITNLLERFAGRGDTQRAFVRRNAAVTDELGQRAASQPGEEISRASMQSTRAELSAPFREVAAISPRANTILERLTERREEMTRAYREYRMQGTRQALRDAQAARGDVEMLERVLEREANRTGNVGLAQRVRDARTALAQSHDVEGAANPVTGNVNAHEIGALLDEGRRLTGDLSTIAAAGRAAGLRRYTGPAENLPPVGTGQTGVALAPLYAAAGNIATGNVAGTAAAGLPLAGPASRRILLSGILDRRPELAPMLVPMLTGSKAVGNLPED